MRSFFRCWSLVCAVLGAAASAQAQSPSSYPDRPIRLVVAFPPGGATDTLARQVAVFTYLPVYIERIKYNRTVRGPYSPGEASARAAYSLAAYQISQDYAKTHTPAEAAAFERLHGQYEMNSDFYKDWSKRLIGPQSAAAYRNMEVEGAGLR